MSVAPGLNTHDLRPIEPCEPVRTAFRDPAVRLEWRGGRPNREGTAAGVWRVTRAILIKQHGHPPAVVNVDVA